MDTSSKNTGVCDGTATECQIESISDLRPNDHIYVLTNKTALLHTLCDRRMTTCVFRARDKHLVSANAFLPLFATRGGITHAVAPLLSRSSVTHLDGRRDKAWQQILGRVGSNCSACHSGAVLAARISRSTSRVGLRRRHATASCACLSSYRW